MYLRTILYSMLLYHLMICYSISLFILVVEITPKKIEKVKRFLKQESSLIFFFGKENIKVKRYSNSILKNQYVLAVLHTGTFSTEHPANLVVTRKKMFSGIEV